MNKQSLLRSAIQFALSSYAFQIVNFAISILLIRSLAPESFGIFALLIALKEIAHIIFGFSAPQYFILSDGKRIDFENSLGLSLISAAAIILFGGLSVIISLPFDQSNIAVLFLLLCIAQGIDNVASIFLAPIERNTEFFKLSIIRNCSALLSLIIATGIAVFWSSVWVLIIREILLAAFLFMAAYKFSVFGIAVSFNFERMVKTIVYSYKLNLSRAAEILFYRSPEIVINRWFGLAQAGYFFQSRNFLMILLKIPNTVLDQILFASFAQIHRTKGISAEENIRMFYFLCRIMMNASLAMSLFSPVIFLYLYGQTWAASAEILGELAWFIFFAALFNFLQAYCYAKKEQKSVFLSYLFGIFAFSLVSYYAIAASNLTMLAWGATFSMGVACLVLLIFSRLIMNITQCVQIFWLPVFCFVFSLFSTTDIAQKIGQLPMVIFFVAVFTISVYEMRRELATILSKAK